MPGARLPLSSRIGQVKLEDRIANVCLTIPSATNDIKGIANDSTSSC